MDHILPILDSFHENIDSLLEIDDHNQQQALENLLITFHFRHDLIHHVFCALLGMDKKVRMERRIDQIIDNISLQVGRLTPDVVAFQNDQGEFLPDLTDARFIRIIDFSVSSRGNLSIKEKNF